MIAVVVAGMVIALVAIAVMILRAPLQEDLGFTDPPSCLDDLDTDEGIPW